MGELGRKETEADKIGIPIPIRGIQDETGKWHYGTLTYKQIKELNTSFLVASIGLYNDYAAFNVLPHGKGTMAERSTVIQILKILKQEDNLFQSWELEKKMKK